MSLSYTRKKEIINAFKITECDTGSVFIQVALLTTSINQLIAHLKLHKYDQSSKRGLLKKVSIRKKFLKYLKKRNELDYVSLTRKLSLRK